MNTPRLPAGVMNACSGRRGVFFDFAGPLENIMVTFPPFPIAQSFKTCYNDFMHFAS